jgi:small-conductance mechanosensitive channel
MTSALRLLFLASLALAAVEAASSLPSKGQEAPPARSVEPPAEEPAPPKRPVRVVPDATDAEIARRLQGIMEATGWFRNPRVAVRDGVVFLDGAAETADHRQWAGALAENTQGSVAVVNRIEVETDLRSTLEHVEAELTSLQRRTIQAWPLAVVIVAIIAATWLVAKIVAMTARRVLSGRIASRLLLGVVVRALAFPAILLGAYFVLQIAGLTRLALTVLGGTGLIGIIIGFAFRDIAENFLASLLLSIRNPFRSGDLIEVAGHTGIVQNLNTRSTVLLALDGNHIQIPNATVFKSTIKNYSSIPSRRAEFTVGIGYDSSATRAQELIAQVLSEHPAVLDSPEPLVLVDELGAATVNLRVYYWFDSSAYAPNKINSALLRLSKNALLKHGIELPDPAREVVFPKGVPVIQTRKTTQPQTRTAPVEAPPLAHAEEETSAATPAEGSLANESKALSETAAGSAPEGQENLLKDPPKRNGRDKPGR